MSMAFYPQSGMVLYGSEQAAMKAAVGVRLPGKEEEEDEVPLPVATFDRMTSQERTSLPIWRPTQGLLTHFTACLILRHGPKNTGENMFAIVQDSTVSLPKALPPRRFSKDLSPTKHYVEINGVTG